MKIAILGATGMLGSMLVSYLADYFDLTVTVRKDGYKAPAGVEVKYLDAETCTDQDIVNAVKGCEWIINAIGIIKQKLNDDRKAQEVNTIFPYYLDYATKDLGSKVIQIATDCIYSGQTGDYNELCLPSPVDTYGRTKEQGEVKEDNFYNIRCSIVGLEDGTPYSLLGWFLNQPSNATINGYINHLWNGVTTLQFAKVCRGIIEYQPELPDIQHLVPADRVSKYELLKIFADAFRMDDIYIEPIEAEDAIDRTLTTVNKKVNCMLWEKAGYVKPPTIEKMVMELARWRKR